MKEKTVEKTKKEIWIENFVKSLRELYAKKVNEIKDEEKSAI